MDASSVLWKNWHEQLKELLTGIHGHQKKTLAFFVLGIAACEHPALVRKIASAGHEVGAHGWSHTPVYRQPRRQFRSELRRTIDELQALTGNRAPTSASSTAPGPELSTANDSHGPLVTMVRPARMAS